MDGQSRFAARRRHGAGQELLPGDGWPGAASSPSRRGRCIVRLVLLRVIASRGVVMDWQAMVFLGAYHGINPGMGWLFAVALGLQHGSARGVWRALPPIALGHAVSVGAVLFTAMLAGLVV